jgi:hypothetical protein
MFESALKTRVSRALFALTAVAGFGVAVFAAPAPALKNPAPTKISVISEAPGIRLVQTRRGDEHSVIVAPYSAR